MVRLFLLSLILGTALAPVVMSHAAGPKIIRIEDEYEEDWVYSTPWFDYQVHSRFSWTWTE